MSLAETLNQLGRLSPVPGWEEAALEQAIETTGSALDGTALTALATTMLGLTMALTGGIVLIGGPSPIVVAALWLVAAFGMAGLLLGPRVAASGRSARALGGVPDLVGLAVLRIRLSPTPEAAASFAATHTEGPLGRSLAEHVRRSRGSPDAGWRGLTDTWGGRLPVLNRAVALLLAATQAPVDDRERLLDGAHRAALDGTRDRMAQFAAALQGPTTAVYAFGVVLPLALVGALPTASAAGIAVSLSGLVFVYNLVLPATLCGATVWLVTARPAAFPAPVISRTHPELPPRLLEVVLGTITASGASLLVVRATLHEWGVYVVVPGAACGAALYLWYRPVVSVRNRTAAVESGLPDALTIVGGHLRRGNAPETALRAAGDGVSGPTGSAFARAAKIQRRLGVGVEAALLGEHGALTARDSPRLRAAVALLVLASRQGKTGGTVLVSLADHLKELVAVERQTRRDLATIVGTLRSTARYFAPIIAGTTVALAIKLDGATLTGGGAGVSSAGLATSIGLYVLMLATLLSTLATGLDRGADRARIGTEIGTALMSASLLYPLTVAGVSKFL